MRKPILIAAIAAFVSALSAPFATAIDKAELDAHCTVYRTAGKAIVEGALTKKVDATEVAKRVEVLLAESTWLAREYARVYPKGEKLLKTVIDNIDVMKKLSFKELEHEWHDLHYFEKPGHETGINLKDEDNEHFTDPIHTIVHPLLVLKAAQNYASKPNDEDLKSIKEEMEEGLEQMEKSRKVLSSK